jgi:chloramphenicol-sensitive protein RarD
MTRGVSLSVLASVLFGVMYYYTTLLAPLNGEDIFAWRMIFTTPFLIAFVWLTGDNPLVKAIWQRVKETPSLFVVLLVSSALMGVQLWLFLWAPLHNKALEVSLGYFMLPLALIVTGRVVFGERLTRLQTIAALLAFIGVAHELFRVGSFSWPALVVSLGYPVYFVLRRKFSLDTIGGFWFDLVLLTPVAIWFAISGQLTTALVQNEPQLLWLLPILGLLSASALIAYILASRLLNLGLFGLLGYVEPVLLLAVALLLGERLTPQEFFTYGPIWLAVAILVLEGSLFIRKKRRGPNSHLAKDSSRL